jgi:uncharacterized protein
MDLRLRLLPDLHWVLKLNKAEGLSSVSHLGVPDDSLWSVTVTRDDISVVSTHEHLPHQVASEGPWRVFEVAGPLDFSLVGILHTLTGPLKKAGIPVFVISSFDTDYLLVPEATATLATTCWQNAHIDVSG